MEVTVKMYTAYHSQFNIYLKIISTFRCSVKTATNLLQAQAHMIQTFLYWKHPVRTEQKIKQQARAEMY